MKENNLISNKELSNYVNDIQDNNLYLVVKQTIEYCHLLNNSLFILLFIAFTYDIISFLLYLIKHSHIAFIVIYMYTSDEHNENKDLYSINYIHQNYSKTTLNLFVYMITKGFSSMIFTYFSYSILQIVSNVEYRFSYSKRVFTLLKDGKNAVEVIFYLTMIEIFCSVMSFISVYYSLYQIDKIRIILSNRELNRKYAIIYNTSLEVDSK